MMALLLILYSRLICGDNQKAVAKEYPLGHVHKSKVEIETDTLRLIPPVALNTHFTITRRP